MSRREALVLVSRALAMIQMISAFVEATTLPNRLVSLHHYTGHIDKWTSSDSYFQSYDQVGIACVFARIAGLLTMALIFWSCGPRIQSLLLPISEQENPL